MQVQLTGPGYVDETQDCNYQRCVNMYFTQANNQEAIQKGRGFGPLLPTGGLKVLTTLSGVSLRGMWSVNNGTINNVFVVIDQTIYLLNPNDLSQTTTPQVIGTINEPNGILRFAYNPYQFLLVDGSTTGYVYNFKTTGVATYGNVGGGPAPVQTIGTIGGSGGNTYSLTINGISIYTNQNVSSALTGSALATQINLFATSTKVIASYSVALNQLTLTPEANGGITVVESGTGFINGTNGITINNGGPFSSVTGTGNWSETYNLTINGVAIYTNSHQEIGLQLATLVNTINTFTATTGVTASVVSITQIRLINKDSTNLTISESGTNFMAGTNGITVTNGNFASGTVVAFNIINQVNNGFPGASDVVFMDGYFIISQPNTNYLWASNLDDGTTWDGLKYTQASASPGYIVGLAIQKSELWVLGNNRLSIYYDAGNSPGFPFSPREGMSITIGCKSINSIVSLDNSIAFLDSRGYLVQTQTSDLLINTSSAYTLQILSTFPINKEIANYSTSSDCIGCFYVYQGHRMLQWTFPTVNKTWVFDLTMFGWHERPYLDPYSNSFKEHLGYYAVQYNSILLMGGPKSSIIYMMSKKYLDDAGQPIIRIRSFGPINQEFFPASVDEFIIRMQTGTAPQSGPGANPYIMLQYSGDGGHTWSSELPRPIGQTGQYAYFVNWSRLGGLREWIIQLTISDPIDFSIIDASARVTIEAQG